MTIANSILNMVIFSNITGGGQITIDNVKGFGIFYLVVGESILVSKFFVHNRESGISTIDEGIYINFNIVIAEYAWCN
jgi:hypothetical protein